MDTTYSTHVLDNGLTILLKEIHTAPVISHWVWYRVGSRNEIPGKTGLSHWVEHMQFKGTQKFPSEFIDREISRHGGHMNAFTYLDWTAFFETMPADAIDAAIDMEADRMSNSLYDPEEVESERTVIISEREGQRSPHTHTAQKLSGKRKIFIRFPVTICTTITVHTIHRTTRSLSWQAILTHRKCSNGLKPHTNKLLPAKFRKHTYSRKV